MKGGAIHVEESGSGQMLPSWDAPLESNRVQCCKELLPFAEELLDDVRAGQFSVGVQAVVRRGNDVLLDVAAGVAAPGTAMAPSTMHNLYCGTKPVTAVALAAELGRVGLDVDVEIDDVLSAGFPIGTTARHLLQHSVGLDEPQAFQFLFTPQEERARLLDPKQLALQVRTGIPVYSEVAAWHLLGCMIEVITDKAIQEVIDGIANRLGLANLALVVESPSRDIGVYFDMVTDPPLPLLHDRLPRFSNRTFPAAIGGYASMQDLAQWYRVVLDDIGGKAPSVLAPPDVLSDLTRVARPRQYDSTLKRECSFGSGFMTDLVDHHFGKCPSAAAFGHVGFMGNSFAFADPDNDLVVALLYNGLFPNPQAGIEVRRPRQIFEIYRLLSLS